MRKLLALILVMGLALPSGFGATSGVERAGGSSGVSNPATENLDMGGNEITNVEAISTTGTAQRYGVSGGSYIDFNDNAGYVTVGGADGTLALVKVASDVGTNYVPTHGAEITDVAGKQLSVSAGVLNFDGQVLTVYAFNNGTASVECPGEGACTSTAGSMENITIVPFAGTIRNLSAKTVTAPGSGKSWDITLFKNNSSTALTCIIADTATTCSDSSNSVSFAAGDTFGWKITGSGTPTSTGGVGLTALFVGD